MIGSGGGSLVQGPLSWQLESMFADASTMAWPDDVDVDVDDDDDDEEEEEQEVIFRRTMRSNKRRQQEKRRNYWTGVGGKPGKGMGRLSLWSDRRQKEGKGRGKGATSLTQSLTLSSSVTEKL